MFRRTTFLFLLLLAGFDGLGQSFSLKGVLSYPFPSELTAAAAEDKIVWAVNEQGRRNIYAATGPLYKANKVTSYDADDAQELTSLSISKDGQWIVFVRGGDHGSRDGTIPVNAASLPVIQKVQVCSVPFAGGKVNELSEGDNPVINPNSASVVFIKAGQVMTASINGGSAASQMFYAKGVSSGLIWSPDGSKLAFVSSRGDHSFIGVYTTQTLPIQWILPGFSKDSSPRWSPNGEELVFIRTPGTGLGVDSILSRKQLPWEIWKAKANGIGGAKLWTAPKTLRGSFPSMDGAANLLWADGKIVFSSYESGWPLLYAMNPDGSQRIMLTPGNFAVEHVKLSSNKKWLVFAANTGGTKEDMDRRHIYKVSIDKADMVPLSSGAGLETYPVITSLSSEIIALTATSKRPMLPALIKKDKSLKVLASELVPGDFPERYLVTPQQVTFKAADGNLVYGQLFKPDASNKKSDGVTNKPAIVYVHGGPQRQMLLGWHYMDYYSIDYALNQYLVSLGFTVLSVNYRLGTGYGYEFHKPAGAGSQGASEYQDIKAAGLWLAKQEGVDPKRIGIYGGSYGGYLVALALGKDSEIFAAGVDIHGVNNRFGSASTDVKAEAPDAAEAERLAVFSSPITYLDSWKSPVLLIHADDDRNVNFSQTVDLVKRFQEKGFSFESLAIPDDTHHWMKFENALKVSEATAEFLKRKLMP
ncbi:MAG: prolyl oligopeptidase family serine peptidase [Pedobacter sp.]